MQDRAVTDWTVRRALIEACRQYDLSASDYLAGVISGLSGLPGSVEGLTPPEPPPDESADRAVDRMREFYRGRIAALEWAAGITTAAPI